MYRDTPLDRWLQDYVYIHVHVLTSVDGEVFRVCRKYIANVLQSAFLDTSGRQTFWGRILWVGPFKLTATKD